MIRYERRSDGTLVGMGASRVRGILDAAVPGGPGSYHHHGHTGVGMNQREALEKAEEMLRRAESSLGKEVSPHYPQYIQLADKYMTLASELARVSVV